MKKCAKCEDAWLGHVLESARYIEGKKKSHIVVETTDIWKPSALCGYPNPGKVKWAIMGLGDGWPGGMAVSFAYIIFSQELSLRLSYLGLTILWIMVGIWASRAKKQEEETKKEFRDMAWGLG